MISLIFKIFSPNFWEKKPLENFSGIFSTFGSSRAVESVLSENLMTTFDYCNDNIF